MRRPIPLSLSLARKCRSQRLAALLGTLSVITFWAASYPLANASGSVTRSRIETIQFRSELVNKVLPYNVILPPGYRAARTSRYPVLYLLHGFGGHYSDWVTRTNVADYAAQYRM